MTDKIQLFAGKEVRTVWDDKLEEIFFSIVDVVGVLTDQETTRGASTYWAVLKKRLKKEGADELLTNCKQLRLIASDGKKRLTDVGTTEQILRLVQSIPSPKAEPFKQWLAQVGSERIEETIDPEQAIVRAKAVYARKGYSGDWINQRIQSIVFRNELTDEWKSHGVKDKQYAILTNIMHETWSGISIKDHKKMKGLKKGNLRDNMTNVELVMTMLSEVSATELSKKEQPEGFNENKAVAIAGAEVAKQARIDLEAKTKRKVVSSQNANDLRLETSNPKQIK